MITLEYGETKNDDPRSVPIVRGDMFNALSAEKRKHDKFWPHSPWVFSRKGEMIKDFRWAWDEACRAAGVPGLHFHEPSANCGPEYAACGDSSSHPDEDQWSQN